MCGPNIFATDDAIALQNAALHDLYNLQAQQISSAFQYDCAAFDKNGVCLSVGGRFVDVGTNSAHAADAFFIGGYRLSNGFSIGDFLDMAAAPKGGQGIEVDSVPLIGVYADWAQRPDGAGLAAHFSAGFNKDDVTLTRSVVAFPPFFFSEPGSGTTSVYTRGISGMFTYGVPFEGGTVIPYLGLQHTSISRGGYTEAGSAFVIDPLTFSTLTDSQTTVSLGVHGAHRISPHWTLKGTLGFEHDFVRHLGANSFTSALGNGAINFGNTYRATRGVAAIGGDFDVDANHKVVTSLTYRQEAFNAQTSLSGLVAYQVGF